MKLRNIVLLVVALVAVAGLIGRKMATSNATQTAPGAGQRASSSLSVSAQLVHPQTLNTRITATGSLLANEEVVLQPETSGKVEKILFKEGSVVSLGDLLVKINDDVLQAELDKVTPPEEAGRRPTQAKRSALQNSGDQPAGL